MRLVYFAAVSLVACSSDPGPKGAVQPDAAVSPFAIACDDALTGFYDAPTGLPAFDRSRRGEVIKCGLDRAIAVTEIDAWLRKERFVGVTVKSAVKVYRIAFRTERLNGEGGVSGALVFVPEVPRQGPRSLVVTAHGTVGGGAACAPSRSGLLTAEHTDATAAHGMSLSLAALGHTVIAPDYAGYGFGGVVQWLLSEDEAHSVLDATRAARKLIPALDRRNFLIGHSQGGHAVLSAHAHASTYGVEGELTAVAAMAPPWWVGKTYAAMLSPLAGLTTTKDAGALAYALLYFHGHAAAYDKAPLLPFRSDKRDAVAALANNECTQGILAGMPKLGESAADFFDPPFVEALGLCGVVDACDAELAKTWLPRFRADRPAVDPKGAPIVIWHGGKDDGVAVDRAQCGVDKLVRDGATSIVTACGDPEAGHDGIVERQMSWLDGWIDARVRGVDSPGCTAFATLGPGGAAATCATPPTNDD